MIKTPALRVLKENQKPHSVRTYSPLSYVLARENLGQTLLTVVLTDSYTGRVAVPFAFLQSRFVFKSIKLRVSSARTRSKFNQSRTRKLEYMSRRG